MPDPLAELDAMAYDGARIDELSFLWAGGFEPGQPHYHGVHGPSRSSDGLALLVLGTVWVEVNLIDESPGADRQVGADEVPTCRFGSLSSA